MNNRVETKLNYFEWHKEDQTTWGEIQDSVKGLNDVLDVGAGNGWLARQIYKSGVQRVVGTDIDTAILSLNDEESSAGLTGVVAAAESLPFENESFDCVIAKDIIEHLLYPAEAIEEIYRVLRKGGLLYIATPAANSKTFFDDYTHIRPFTDRSLRSLLEDQGFAVDQTFYTGNFPGMGRWMRIRHSNRLPNVVKVLARLGIRRGNIHAWARKPKAA